MAMTYGDMRDRVVLLCPGYNFRNELGETVPAWTPFNPFRENNRQHLPVLTVTEGQPRPQYLQGSEADLSKYSIWAKVTPTTGREYEEAQKLRAELTYNVKMRYSAAVRSDFKVLHRGRILDIISVININGLGRELRLVCSEVDTYGKEV